MDVIIPSDYMISRMIQEEMLLPLHFENIPNFEYIDAAYKNMPYDPENRYSVPYTWGTTGITYNEKYVDPADATGWELLWNEKYADKILMFGNSRDAFGVAELILGYDINTTDDAQLREAAELLKKQKPLVQQYVMDECFEAMENEEAWIVPYYAGDALSMAAVNENLKFYHPEQGFNLFVDAMCIPTCSRNPAAAELFINFLCNPEIAGQNMAFLGYGVPISAAKEYMDAEVVSNPVAYPDETVMEKGAQFLYLPVQVNQRIEELWLEAKTN